MQHIQVSWDDKAQTIICCTFLQGWTLDEFHEVYALTGDMIRQSSNHVIGIIIDDSRNTSPPPNALSAFKRIFKQGNLPMAIIGGHHLTKLLLKIVEGSIQTERPIFRASNVDEARLALKKNMEDRIDL